MSKLDKMPRSFISVHKHLKDHETMLTSITSWFHKLGICPCCIDIESLENTKNIGDHINDIIDIKAIKATKSKVINDHQVLIHCPKHKQNIPSLMLDNNTKECYCFSCGFKGKIMDLVKDLEDAVNKG